MSPEQLTEISVEHTRQGLNIHYDGNGFEVREDRLPKIRIVVDGIYIIEVEMDQGGSGNYIITAQKCEVELFRDETTTDWDELEAEQEHLDDIDLQCPECEAPAEHLEQYGSVLATGYDLYRCLDCGCKFSVKIPD